MILYTTYVAWCLDLDLIFSKLLLQWMVDEKELRVIHYTLGPLKPWDWWTAWLVKPVGVWQDVRQTLEESLPGTGGGRSPHDQLVVKVLFILPVLLLSFGYYQSCFQVKTLSFQLAIFNFVCTNM
jgi:hypothetical protein